MNRLKATIKIALLFFTIGTLLLILHFIFNTSNFIIWLGYMYVLLAIVINSILLIILIVALFIDKEKLETLKSIGVLSLNIPIAFVYFQMVIDSL
ncbi:hypothetical protein [Pontimicrobium sp. MEBiC01747]